MKTTTIWVIRVALTVQFLGVLAVPTLLAASEAPRGMWMAEWMRPQVAERTIGVLRVRDGKLSFVEQIGQVDWELDLSSVKRVATINGGRSISIVSASGEEFVITIMDPNMALGSPKKALAIIERALQSVSTNSR
jgi:hypothetical protein